MTDETTEAEIAKLRAENDRLRKRLAEIAPRQTKTGRTFFAFAMLLLALSLAFGMFFARVLSRP